MSVHTERLRCVLAELAEHRAPDVLFRVTRGLHVIRAETRTAGTHHDNEGPQPCPAASPQAPSTTKGRALYHNPTTGDLVEAAEWVALAEDWPVGRRVRHRYSMWVGTIVPGDAGDCPGAYVGTAPAHCLLPTDRGTVPGAVCVQWNHPDKQPGAAERAPLSGPWPHDAIGPAWMRPGVLRLLREGVR